MKGDTTLMSTTGRSDNPRQMDTDSIPNQPYGNAVDDSYTGGSSTGLIEDEGKLEKHSLLGKDGENINNNVLNSITASQSAIELTAEQNLNRHVRMSRRAKRSTRTPLVKYQTRRLDYSSKSRCLAGASKSCTLACDILRPDYKNPSSGNQEHFYFYHDNMSIVLDFISDSQSDDSLGTVSLPISENEFDQETVDFPEGDGENISMARPCEPPLGKVDRDKGLDWSITEELSESRGDNNSTSPPPASLRDADSDTNVSVASMVMNCEEVINDDGLISPSLSKTLEKESEHHNREPSSPSTQELTNTLSNAVIKDGPRSLNSGSNYVDGEVEVSPDRLSEHRPVSLSHSDLNIHDSFNPIRSSSQCWPSDNKSKVCANSKRNPLPQEIMNAIQLAVANGDFDDVNSVEVADNGYLLRRVTQDANNEIEKEGPCCTSYPTVELDSSGCGMISPIAKYNDSSPDSQTDCLVCTYEHVAHNDILHSGQKIDVMSENAFTSVTESPKETPVVENVSDENDPIARSPGGVREPENEDYPESREDTVCAINGSTELTNTSSSKVVSSPSGDVQIPQQYTIDCMGALLDDSSGDVLVKGLAKICIDTKDTIDGDVGSKKDTHHGGKRHNRNVNKYVDYSHTSVNSNNNDQKEMENSDVIETPRGLEKTIRSKRQFKKTLVKEEVTNVESSQQGSSPSKSNFLSILLNMIGDDKEEQDQQSDGSQGHANQRRHKESEQQKQPETEEEEGDTVQPTSFPRGVDSIEPNDKIWWLNMKENLAMRNRQTRVRRKLTMKRASRAIGSKGKKRDSAAGFVSSELSLDSENKLKEGSTMGMSKCSSNVDMWLCQRNRDPRIRKGKRRHGGYNLNGYYGMDSWSYSRPSAGKGYCSKYLHESMANYKYYKTGECECCEEETKTPFCRVGDEYSILKDYYSQMPEQQHSFASAQKDMHGKGDDSAMSDTGDETNMSNTEPIGVRICRPKFVMPSVMETERLRNLSLKGSQTAVRNASHEMWDYTKIDNFSLIGCHMVDSPLFSGNGSRRHVSEKICAMDELSNVKFMEQKHSLYTTLLHANAQREMNSLNIVPMITEEYKWERNLLTTIKPNPGGMMKKKVKFSDIGIKTLRNTEDQWNSTVNEMLLKSEKVMEGGVDIDSRYPRSDSARKVDAVPAKTFHFLNELLEQDMQEQQMSSNEYDTPWKPTRKSVAASILQEQSSESTPNLPSIRREKPQVASIKGGLKLSNTHQCQLNISGNKPLRSREDVARSPVFTPTAAVTFPRVTQRSVADSIHKRPHQRVVSKSNPPLKSPDQTVHKNDMKKSNEAVTPSTLDKTNGWRCSQVETLSMRGSVSAANNVFLDKYSDVFNYYVSPFLRDRAENAIVDMYP